MLYLNSIENAEASPTEKKYAICHDEVPSMPNIPELAPSRELLTQWQSEEISWEIFRAQFIEEMRTDYLRNEMSRLKGLAKYSLEDDVTLHSPEPSGEQTYRTILEEIVNVIWESAGQTERVINLAREPIEEAQLIEADPQQMATIPQEEIANLVRQILPEVAPAIDDEIRLIQENAELKARIDQLEGEINTHETTIDNLRQTVSEKEGIISNQNREIQLLNDAIGERNRDNDGLNRRNHELEKQVNTLRRTLSEKEGAIQSLNDVIGKKDRKIAELQDINTHLGIRDIAVEAMGDKPEFRKYFRTLDIDKNLPKTLRTWLMGRLKQALSIASNDQTPLDKLIRNYTDFNVDYDNEDYKDFDEFDKYDNQLAHAIRTQRNLIEYHEDKIDERTLMGRALCCFLAAALLSSKLPEPKQPAFK